MDPRTGHVRAMVGGRDFGESRFNRAMQAKRQPGRRSSRSCTRPRSKRAITPATLITNLDDPIVTLAGRLESRRRALRRPSSMTLRTALRTSSNRAAVQLLRAVGIPQAVSTRRRLGVGTPPSVPSLALGAGEVTLHVDDGGLRRVRQSAASCRSRSSIRRVEDSDGTRAVRRRQPSGHRAVTEATAFLMASMLADVINARHGVPRAAERVHAAGRGQDRDDQRLPGRVVRRLHAVGRDRRLGRLRSAAHDLAQRIRRRSRRADLGARS